VRDALDASALDALFEPANDLGQSRAYVERVLSRLPT
jgi:hypothetical protein